MNLMSPNSKLEKRILPVIKWVLENRQDIDSNDNFISEIALYTLNNVSVMDMISDKPFWINSSYSQIGSDDLRLTEIIKLLAIINKTIDYLLCK